MTTKHYNEALIDAVICLYGIAKTGFGYIVQLPNGERHGDGQCTQSRSMTVAMWEAQNFIPRGKGVIRIFAAGGHQYADVPSYEPLPWASAMVWKDVT